MNELRQAGIDNFNLDLMYALPAQTLAQALADVRSALALQPTHISHYQLTLEPGTGAHGRQRNVGWRAAHAGVVAFTDDDCVVDPGWLAGCPREFSDPLVVAVSEIRPGR